VIWRPGKPLRVGATIICQESIALGHASAQHCAVHTPCCCKVIFRRLACDGPYQQEAGPESRHISPWLCMALAAALRSAAVAVGQSPICAAKATAAAASSASCFPAASAAVSGPGAIAGGSRIWPADVLMLGLGHVGFGRGFTTAALKHTQFSTAAFLQHTCWLKHDVPKEHGNLVKPKVERSSRQHCAGSTQVVTATSNGELSTLVTDPGPICKYLASWQGHRCLSLDRVSLLTGF